MTAEEVLQLVNPSALVYFEDELLTADGTKIVAAGQLAGIKLTHTDSWGAEISVWDSPVAEKPTGIAGPNELAERIRPASADEERSWLRRAENLLGPVARTGR